MFQSVEFRVDTVKGLVTVHEFAPHRRLSCRSMFQIPSVNWCSLELKVHERQMAAGDAE